MTGPNKSFSSVHTGKASVAADDVVVSVPGDFPTVNDALNSSERILPASTGSAIKIEIQSGHAIETPIDCIDADYRDFHIVSADAVVPVGSAFPSGENVIDILNAEGPTIDTKIDCQGNGNNGMFCRERATFHFQGGTNSGIINSPGKNLLVQNMANGVAYDCDFSGAQGTNVHISRACAVSLGGVLGPDLSGAGEHGLEVVRASIVRCSGANLSGAATHGIDADRGSVVAAIGANLDNCGGGANISGGSILYCQNGSVSSPGVYGMRINRGSTVDASNVSMSNSGGDGVIARNGAKVIAQGGSVTGSSGDDMAIDNGGIIVANDCSTSSQSGSPAAGDTSVSTLNNLTAAGYITG